MKTIDEQMFDYLPQRTIRSRSQAPKLSACHMFTLIFNVNYITFSYPQIRSFTVPIGPQLTNISPKRT